VFGEGDVQTDTESGEGGETDMEEKDDKRGRGERSN
jgi:hypothetical protein